MDANKLLDEYYPTIDHVELGELYCRDKVIIIMKEYAEKWHESEVNKLKQADVSRLVLPAFEDCREVITKLTEEAYQLLLKQPDERKVITMSVLIKFYSELKKIAQAGKTCG